MYCMTRKKSNSPGQVDFLAKQVTLKLTCPKGKD